MYVAQIHFVFAFWATGTRCPWQSGGFSLCDLSAEVWPYNIITIKKDGALRVRPNVPLTTENMLSVFGCQNVLTSSVFFKNEEPDQVLKSLQDQAAAMAQLPTASWKRLHPANLRGHVELRADELKERYGTDNVDMCILADQGANYNRLSSTVPALLLGSKVFNYCFA